MKGSHHALRKRDRFLGVFNRHTNKKSPIPRTPPTSASLQTSDLFLQDVLKRLTEKEQSVIQEHMTSNTSATIQAVYDAAKKQKYTCEQKRWLGSDKVDKVLLWLDRFKSVGDIIANVDPVHIGLPWAGIRMLLEVCQEYVCPFPEPDQSAQVAVTDNCQMKALVGGMDLALCMANRLRAYFSYYQHLSPGLTTDNFRKVLVELYAHVLCFFANAIRVYAMNTAARKIQAFWRDSDLLAFESQCDKLADRADIEANNCDRELRTAESAEAARWRKDLSTTLQQLGAIRSMQSSLDDLQVKAVLSKLPVAWEATFNSPAEEAMSTCLEGTRSNILDNIHQWACNPDSRLMYWLCGKAGTGKSTIARTVARRCNELHASNEQPRLAATFFFKRGENTRSNADLFFPTIARQLADLFPQLRTPLSQAIDDESFLGRGRGIQEQFEKLVLKPLLTLDSATLPQNTMMIVIDALDECDRSTDIGLIIRSLARMASQGEIRLRIFVTSRPELPVKLGFRKLDNDGHQTLHEDVVLETVQEQTISQDIRTYFDAEFAKIREERYDDPLPTDWPSKNDVEILVELTAPLFIFASTVCRFVSERTPRLRLQTILAARHASVTSYMARTYLPILNHQVLEEEGAERKRIINDFRRVVGSIIFAADPLSVEVLASLLRFQQHNFSEVIDDVLRRLHSVLEIPSNRSSPVKLLHLSFRDFLTDKERANGEEFWIDDLGTHKHLADCCLRLLCEDGALQHDMCRVKHPGTKRHEILESQIETQIPPDVAYACKYWAFHVIKGVGPLLDDSLAHRFLQQHFLHWLEALSWLGKLSSGIGYINELLLLAQGDGSIKVTEFLLDARRFVLQNRYVIDLAPLQTYHSAMIFAPRQSLVRMTFEQQTPRLWARLPRVKDTWNTEMLALEGHDDSVWAVSFSPDGQLLASASSDKTIRLWDANTGEQIHKVEGHTETVNSVAFSPDGQMIASASQDHTVRLWNVITGEQIWKLEGHKKPVRSVAYTPDGQVIVSASLDGTLRKWKQATGEQIAIIGLDDKVGINSVACSAKIIAAGTIDDTIKLYDMATGMPRGEIFDVVGDENGVEELAFSPSPDSQYLASATGETVSLWDMKTLERVQEIIHDFTVSSVAFSPDGLTVASTSVDATILLWNLAGEQILELEGHDNFINAVTFSPDGHHIASASDDETVRVWNKTGGQRQKSKRTEIIVAGHDSSVLSVAFSPNGRYVASGSWDSTARLWDFATGEQKQKLEHSKYAGGLAFSPDSCWLAVSGCNTLTLWNVTTGKQLWTAEHRNYNPSDCSVAVVKTVVFSSDGRTIASAASRIAADLSWLRGGSARLWSATTGRMLHAVPIEENVSIDLTLRFSFTPDGKLLQTREGNLLQDRSGSRSEACDTSRPTAVLEISDQWIRHQGRDILWLPSEYRGDRGLRASQFSAVHERSIVVAGGLSSREVDVFTLKDEADWNC